MSEIITDAEVLQIIENVEGELNALRVKLKNKSITMGIDEVKPETSTKEPKNDLKDILSAYKLPNDEDIVKAISKEIEKKNISNIQVKRTLESICRYRDRNKIEKIRGYIISCFRKY